MQAKSTFSYFYWSTIVTVIGLALATWLGWIYEGTLIGAATYLAIGMVLTVLEVSLSFDNAVVNAKKLEEMTPKWRKAFLTWGILIAVFGMRIVFPILVVVVSANIGPITALVLAATEPETYQRIISDAHISISAFGGAFLMMVGLTFFLDAEKDVHWVASLERFLKKFGSVKGAEIAIVLAVMLGLSTQLDEKYVAPFMVAGVGGLLTFLAVELVGHVLDRSEDFLGAAAKGGLGAFLYLEVLDASFSFDGVIGAFALTQNLFLIAIGLGIGAMFVRSMTVMLVEKGTLSEYRFLEHGAFWSILVLSAVMFAQSKVHIPEVFTGLIGASLIGLSLYSSIRWARKADVTTPSFIKD